MNETSKPISGHFSVCGHRNLPAINVGRHGRGPIRHSVNILGAVLLCGCTGSRPPTATETGEVLKPVLGSSMSALLTPAPVQPPGWISMQNDTYPRSQASRLSVEKDVLPRLHREACDSGGTSVHHSCAEKESIRPAGAYLEYSALRDPLRTFLREGEKWDIAFDDSATGKILIQTKPSGSFELYRYYQLELWFDDCVPGPDGRCAVHWSTKKIIVTHDAAGKQVEVQDFDPICEEVESKLPELVQKYVSAVEYR